jgi:hypothetical protein
MAHPRFAPIRLAVGLVVESLCGLFVLADDSNQSPQELKLT